MGQVDKRQRTGRSPWRPHLARDFALVAVVFIAFTGWTSHQFLLQQPETLLGFKWTETRLRPPENITIGYAISMTGCNPSYAHLDGAAILKYSIQRFDSSSRYKSKFYAFVHPDAVNCSADLQKLGYNVQVRPTPVNTTDIRGPLKKFVEGSSCCGSKEFLKLYSFTLTDHPVVVHLDMDVAVFRPLNDLYDSMLEGPDSPARHRLRAMWTDNVTELAKQINAFFTRDYNMLKRANFRSVGETSMQGGFLMVRPNETVFQEYVDTILEGKYDADFGGWGAPEVRYGGTYGAAQIQGLVTYYYGHLHPNTAVELNRCYYNAMVDKPRDNNGTCLAPTAKGYCQDCRETNISQVFSTHYTVCQKPWLCHYHGLELCRETHHQWFRIRYDMEMELSESGPSYSITGKVPTRRKDVPWVVNDNWTFCHQGGRDNYIPLKEYRS